MQDHTTAPDGAELPAFEEWEAATIPFPPGDADDLELRRRAFVRDFAEVVSGRRGTLRHSKEEVHQLLADLRARAEG